MNFFTPGALYACCSFCPVPFSLLCWYTLFHVSRLSSPVTVLRVIFPSAPGTVTLSSAIMLVLNFFQNNWYKGIDWGCFCVIFPMKNREWMQKMASVELKLSRNTQNGPIHTSAMLPQFTARVMSHICYNLPSDFSSPSFLYLTIMHNCNSSNGKHKLQILR